MGNLVQRDPISLNFQCRMGKEKEGLREQDPAGIQKVRGNVADPSFRELVPLRSTGGYVRRESKKKRKNANPP